jgi:GNAT superfamily N-acetyltransferase
LAEIDIVEREMTDDELARMKAGFDEHAIESGNPPDSSERYGFVALGDNTFVGCVSGLAYRNETGYANWFYITDLFVEKAHRNRGIGAALLQELEKKVSLLGIGNIWTWTAGYEAPGFHAKQGYEVFCEMDNWYSSGHSRFGFRKALSRNPRSNNAINPDQ